MKKIIIPYWLRGALILMIAYYLFSIFFSVSIIFSIFFNLITTISGLHFFFFTVLPTVGITSFLSDGMVRITTFLYLGFVGALWGNIYKNWSAKDKESKRIKKISLITYFILLAVTIASYALIIIGFSTVAFGT